MGEKIMHLVVGVLNDHPVALDNIIRNYTVSLFYFSWIPHSR